MPSSSWTDILPAMGLSESRWFWSFCKWTFAKKKSKWCPAAHVYWGSAHLLFTALSRGGNPHSESLVGQSLLISFHTKCGISFSRPWKDCGLSQPPPPQPTRCLIRDFLAESCLPCRWATRQGSPSLRSPGALETAKRQEWDLQNNFAKVGRRSCPHLCMPILYCFDPCVSPGEISGLNIPNTAYNLCVLKKNFTILYKWIP